ncbi:recombinase family protein [Actinoplanes sp. NPDC051633]|uniref:recombinase family protein n=1 Tax=Actinoplanes sp. NPDC051633 TaxID=3155670 RepID=UPI003414B4D5
MQAFTGRRFPLRAYGGVWAGQLRWGKLTHGRALGVLSNPAYAGVYAYGQHRIVRTVRPDGTVRTASRVLPRDQWQILIHDHHDGYLTWQQYLDIEAKLAANRTNAGGRPPREGTPLCQGIISCGHCGHRVGTRYQARNQVAYYDCMGHRDAARGQRCRSVAASTIDAAVTRLLLSTLTSEQITLALDAAEQVQQRHTRAHRAAELAVQRAQYEADRAERAFAQVEPENRLVARTLEARWEAKLAALTDAKAALTAARDCRPPLPDRDSLQRLAAALPRLWDHPATSAKDRKWLLRTVISDVTVLSEHDSDQIHVGVRWHTGAAEGIITTRRQPDRTPTGAVELARRLGGVLSDDQLAETLNAQGFRTGKGHQFDVKAVRWIRHAFKIRAPRTQCLGDGEITIRDCGSFGVSGLTAGRSPAREAS